MRGGRGRALGGLAGGEAGRQGVGAGRQGWELVGDCTQQMVEGEDTAEEQEEEGGIPPLGWGVVGTPEVQVVGILLQEQGVAGTPLEQAGVGRTPEEGGTVQVQV